MSIETNAARESCEKSVDKHPMSARFRGFLPVVVDVETGGFDPQKCALLEIASVVIDMDDSGVLVPGEVFEAAINPFEGSTVEEAALNFTGIDPNDPQRGAVDELAGLQGMIAAIRKQVKHYDCKRAVLVGHNAHFDLDFYNAALMRTQAKHSPFHPFTCFDTATLAGVLLGHTVLAESCKRAEIAFSNSEAHSAAYDAFKTAELFCHMVNNTQMLSAASSGPAATTNKEHVQ